MLDIDTITEASVEALAAGLRQTHDLIPVPDDRTTPCGSGDFDYRLWRDPERIRADEDLDDARAKRARNRRAQGLCGSCFFKVNCAINALQSDSTDGIWAGVRLEVTDHRFAASQRRLAEVIAEEILDTGEIPFRVADLIKHRPEMELLLAEAAVRVKHNRENPRPRRVRKAAADASADSAADKQKTAS